ncbi:Vitamin B12 import system permease protein BtuC [Halomicronema hongdechloris C2206]|uniref:Vitamin B12 import system permease protein BtuC n=1 Tax=Halomicronema hongdechloris C2206 TaxID=1641165 RepID=A0A1Z3HGW8_9CYAN|nr:iron ABC transporter permease [Halomicronema hongdechloris]ASC69536.1 Vitamin B12 import system permease protein BtuC [Halomicronema hongdechloris C2206]
MIDTPSVAPTQVVKSRSAAAKPFPPTGRWRCWGAFVSLGGLVLASFLASLTLGSVSIPLTDILTILLGGEPTRDTWQNIVLQFRLPRAIAASLSGAALAISGLQLQALFRNPLAGPSVLGINAGASLGVALVVLTGNMAGFAWMTGLSQFSVVVAASLGAAITMAVVLGMAHRVRSSLALLIFGLMFGYTTNALVSILLHFSQLDQTLAYLNWTFGSFGGVTWAQIPILLPPIVAGLVLAQLLCQRLNLLLLGEEQARGLGLSIHWIRGYLIVSASLLAGTVTAFCGPIAFLGVAVPHLARSLLGTLDHRRLVPAAALLGTLLALMADLIAQLPSSQTILPLNAVTALLGGPVVIWLMLKRYRLFY